METKNVTNRTTPSAPPVMLPVRSTVFATVKSTALGFLTVAGLGYGLIRAMEAGAGQFSGFRPQGKDAAAAVLGAAVGGLWGLNKHHRLSMMNQRAELVNRYQSNTTIQQDILSQIGGPENYRYRANMPEKIFSNVSTLSMIGWLGSGVTFGSTTESKFTRGMFVTTALSTLGQVASHLFGVGGDIRREHETLSKVEQLALEREAARVGQTQQTK